MLQLIAVQPQHSLINVTLLFRKLPIGQEAIVLLYLTVAAIFVPSRALGWAQRNLKSRYLQIQVYYCYCWVYVIRGSTSSLL